MLFLFSGNVFRPIYKSETKEQHIK